MAKFLYIGRFELPDKEATANRVVANAKLLRELGHEVILAGWSESVAASDGWQPVDCYGFESYEKHKAKTSYEKYRMFSDESPELELLKKHQPEVLIAYDFPAVAFGKLMKYCKKHSIKCIGDVSEWYTNKNKNPIFRVVRAYDSYQRMRVLHKKADGLIVISKYLERYYSEQRTVLVPPLVDMSDEKWKLVDGEASVACDKTRLVYAGWPSKTKERLDLIVDAVAEMKEQIFLDIYGVTEQKYREIYACEGALPENVSFHGRVSHTETIAAVKRADYSLVIREACRKNNAGFPSKLVECISCGTAVLTTDISNVKDYVGDGSNGYVISINNLTEDIRIAVQKHSDVTVVNDTFDYHHWQISMDAFLKGLGIN